MFNRPFYRYGGHIELIRFKEYYNNNNNNNNNNIYRGSPTRQGGFQWGPHALI